MSVVNSCFCSSKLSNKLASIALGSLCACVAMFAWFSLQFRCRVCNNTSFLLRLIHGSWYSADSAWVKTWALFISTVSWTWVHTPHIHTLNHFIRTCPQILLACLARSIRASFCLTRTWKQESRWRWSGCRETPKRNIAPSGPPHPTPLTRCGMRSPLFLRRCVSVDKHIQYMCLCELSYYSSLCCCCCWS